jgi:hypothetical protein
VTWNRSLRRRFFESRNEGLAEPHGELGCSERALETEKRPISTPAQSLRQNDGGVNSLPATPPN